MEWFTNMKDENKVITICIGAILALGALATGVKRTTLSAGNATLGLEFNNDEQNSDDECQDQ